MISPFAIPWLSWLVEATLKGSILILLGAVVLLLIGKHIDARWRHALWLLIVLRLVLPVAPASRFSIFNLLPAHEQPRMLLLSAAASTVPANVQTLRETSSILPVPANWPREARWLAAIWLGGALAGALRMLIASLRIDRAVALAVRRGERSASLEAALRDARLQLGIGWKVEVVECDAVRTPALHGLLRPTLLVPVGFAQSFDAEELRHVMLHELFHLRRFVVAVSWALAALQTLHWFNPLVWFAVSRIKEERELACDELALSFLEEEERLGYGRTILKLLGRFRTAAPVPALVGIVEQRETMKRRFMMIASFRNRTRFSAVFAAAVAAVALVGLTDARGGERRIRRHLDPASHATAEKLHQRVTFRVDNASLSDLLTAVANSAGVNVTQSPELATSDVQKARFTVAAHNVPAHAALMESLAPFGLTARPEASGVSIVKGDCEMMTAEGHEGGIRKKIVMRHHDVMKTEGTSDADKEIIERKMTTEANPPGDKKMVRRFRDVVKIEGPTDAGGEVIEKKVIIRANGSGDKMSCDFKSGKIHRELTMNIEENGVKSEGKLTLDITSAAQ